MMCKRTKVVHFQEQRKLRKCFESNLKNIGWIRMKTKKTKQKQKPVPNNKTENCDTCQRISRNFALVFEFTLVT